MANTPTLFAQSPGLAPWRREAGKMTSLAIPLALTQLAYMAIITTDVIFLGRLGPKVLAASSLASHFFFLFEMLALGVLGAVAPILAQHIGARRFRQIRPTTRHGFWVALVMGLPIIAIIWQAESILLAIGQDPELAAMAKTYLKLLCIGFIPGLWLFVLAEFLAAHARPRATVVVIVVGIGFNALADYTLIFGKFGFPRLELVGAGIASSLVNTLMFLALLGFVLTDRKLRRYRLFGRFWRTDWPQLKEILRVGLPISVADMAESTMFVASTMLMGLVGTTALAAHAVASQLASIAFMVPLGIGQAAAVRVGRAIGAKDLPGAARSGLTALGLSFGISLLPAIAFWFFGSILVKIYLDTDNVENAEVVPIALTFLAIAAFFQFADAVQAAARGALRGLKDTAGPMVITVSGYWGLGLAGAAYFGVYLGYGGQAIWIAMAAGLWVVAILLVIRFWNQCRRMVQAE